MKKKIFLLLAIVAALTLVFVACTEPETPEETTPTVTAAPTDAPTEAPTDDATEAPTDDATEEVTTEEVTTEEVTTEEVTTEAPRYNDYNVPMEAWAVSGHAPGLTPSTDEGKGGMVAAGGLEQGALLHQGAIGIGEIDLGKYDKIIVSYGIDNSDVTIGRYDANANNRIMLTKADTNGTMSPAEDSIVASVEYTLQGWALVTVEIDLSEVDYNGPVFVTYDTLAGTFMLIGKIELIGALIPEGGDETPDEPEIPDEPVIEIPNHHVSVDHVMEKGPNGSANYSGMGDSTVLPDNPNTVDFTADGHTVGADYVISIGGWCCLDGGVAKYIYSVNDGEWMDAVGGIDGEPLPDYFAGLGMPGSSKNGMFNGGNMLKANLSEYAGKTVTVKFGAVSETNNEAIVVMVTLNNVVVPGGETDEPAGPTVEPLAIDIQNTTAVATDPTWVANQALLGPKNAADDLGKTGQIAAINTHNNNYLGDTGYGNIIVGGYISVGTVDLSQYSSVTLVVAGGGAAQSFEGWMEDANGSKLNQTNATFTAGNAQTEPTQILRTITIHFDTDYNGEVRFLFTQTQVVTVVGITFNP